MVRGLSIAAMVCAALALSAGEAQARFGKASRGGSSSSGSGSRPAPGPYRGGAYPGPYYYPYYGYGITPWYWGGPYYYYPRPYGYVPPPPTEAKTEEQKVHLLVDLGANGQINGTGGTLGINFLLEGEHLGLRTDFSAIFARDSVEPATYDSIKLLNAHITYALFSNEFARIRIEGGIGSAFAPDLTTAGPSVGMSAAVGIAGPVGVDAQAHFVPVPYRALDVMAGLVLHIDPVVFRVGWRDIYLNDLGLVDGVHHSDLFDGPYAGISFLF
jgi:hypothetical protein